ncbi:MAG: hypothetical protein B6229_00285 [Spirochaetaceae bacterium 4572_7]|nr:MAG: hypothetical protein B6229_00285 [Spirochaetaceae bacterium 4572_7]
MEKKYPMKIDSETRKALEKRQQKFATLIKKFTGKEQKIPLTKVLKISVKNPIELNFLEATSLQKKLRKKGATL